MIIFQLSTIQFNTRLEERRQWTHKQLHKYKQQWVKLSVKIQLVATSNNSSLHLFSILSFHTTFKTDVEIQACFAYICCKFTSIACSWNVFLCEIYIKINDKTKT